MYIIIYSKWFSVDENFIGAPKMLNNFSCPTKNVRFSNIWTVGKVIIIGREIEIKKQRNYTKSAAKKINLKGAIEKSPILISQRTI